MVSSLIQISARPATISKPKGAHNCWAWNEFVNGDFTFAEFALMWYIDLNFNRQTSKIITLSQLKEKLTSSTSKRYW